MVEQHGCGPEALAEDYMRRRQFIAFLACAVASVIGQSPVVAQTFLTYSCRDGSEFVAAFFAGDRSASLHLDGKAMTLPRRLSLSGTRYTKGDVTLRITKSVTTLTRGKRSTECTGA
jgi:membrane-bound inhibitor of C-type lysozyme